MGQHGAPALNLPAKAAAGFLESEGGGGDSQKKEKEDKR